MGGFYYGHEKRENMQGEASNASVPHPHNEAWHPDSNEAMIKSNHDFKTGEIVFVFIIYWVIFNESVVLYRQECSMGSHKHG